MEGSTGKKLTLYVTCRSDAFVSLRKASPLSENWSTVEPAVSMRGMVDGLDVGAASSALASF